MTKIQKINYRSEAHKLQLDNIRLVTENERLRKALESLRIKEGVEPATFGDFAMVDRKSHNELIDAALRGEDPLKRGDQ